MAEEKKIVVLPYKQILYGIAGFIALWLFLLSFQTLSSIYIPILVSYFLAFLLNPLVARLEKRGFGRVGPSFILLSIFFIAVALFSILMLPKLITQLREFIDNVPAIAQRISTWLSPIAFNYLGYDIFDDWQRFVTGLLPTIREIPAKDIVGSFFQGTMRALGTLASFLIIPILTFYMLKDYHALNRTLMSLFPRRFVPDVEEISRRMSLVLGGLIRGQFLVCSLLAVFYTIALSALGVKLSLFLGVLGGGLNLIPFVGPLVAMLLALILGLIGGGGITLSAGIVGVFLVANLMDNTVLTPKVVGKQMGISPLTIILVLLAGGELLGFLGMLLALPVTAMVKVVGGYFLERYFESKYYLANS